MKHAQVQRQHGDDKTAESKPVPKGDVYQELVLRAAWGV